MKWTHEKPTVEGWYWVRGEFPFDDDYCARVFRYRGELFVELPDVDYEWGCLWSEKVDGFKGLWAGPIEEPEEDES